MTTWNYIIGNEKDFEGAPDWALYRDKCFNKHYWSEGYSAGDRFKCVNSDNVQEYNGSECQSVIIAQRERVTNTAPVATDDSKYNRPCKGITIDVYDVLKAFNVTCPALQHLIKKALAVGQRGHKDTSEDLKDILASAKRAIELSESNK